MSYAAVTPNITRQSNFESDTAQATLTPMQQPRLPMHKMKVPLGPTGFMKMNLP